MAVPSARKADLYAYVASATVLCDPFAVVLAMGPNARSAIAGLVESFLAFSQQRSCAGSPWSSLASLSFADWVGIIA